MSQLNSEELEEAALQMRVSRRCRRAYVHDLRGGLQAINSALELVARASATSGDKQASMQKASEFARRAVAGHEKCLDRVMDQLVPPDQTAGRLNLRSLLAELLHFLQNDAASREITFDFSADDDMTVSVTEGKIRLVLLALITGGLDSLPPGSVLRVALRRLKDDALIEVPVPAAALAASQLAIAVGERWASQHGGRISVEGPTGSARAVRIFLPVAPLDAVDIHAAPA